MPFFLFNNQGNENWIETSAQGNKATNMEVSRVKTEDIELKDQYKVTTDLPSVMREHL